MDKREFKDKAYSLFAHMIKSLSNPHRLEILDLLGQSGRTVEEIASETDMSVANASQHLQILKRSNLVEATREGNFIRYHLAGDNIYKCWYDLRQMGIERVADIEKLIIDFRGKKNVLEAVNIGELLRKMKSGNVILLDVRPEQEYRTGHIQAALSIPIDQLLKNLKSLSKNNEYIAYCRGPFCVFADDAVNLLTKKGFKAKRLSEGFPDWKLKGLPIEVSL